MGAWYYALKVWICYQLPEEGNQCYTKRDICLQSISERSEKGESSIYKLDLCSWMEKHLQITSSHYTTNYLRSLLYVQLGSNAQPCSDAQLDSDVQLGSDI